MNKSTVTAYYHNDISMVIEKSEEGYTVTAHYSRPNGGTWVNIFREYLDAREFYDYMIEGLQKAETVETL